MNELIIYGASGHAKVIIDIFIQQGDDKFVLVDDNPEVTKLLRYRVEQPAAVNLREVSAIIGVGDNKIRKTIKDKLDPMRFSTAIHPNAQLNSFVHIGQGTMVAAGVTINSDTRVGEHCIINTKSSLDHDCKVADFVHIAPGATVCGSVIIGEGAFIGAGATILPNLNIGRWAVIAAGAVVTSDVPDETMVLGVPAKEYND